MMNNESCQKISIEDMNDELLLEILCRFSCYRAAIQCKTVSKRWCSIISDPFYLAKGFSVHREIKDNELPWTLFLTIKTLATPYILSLNFLPNKHPFEVVATFRDLVLCFSSNPSSQVGVFIVCNPLTKQLIALPPVQTYEKPFQWSGLVCQERHRFRVIVVPYRPSRPSPLFANKAPFINFNLVIYLSETGEWKKIDVEIPIRPYVEGFHRTSFQGVVCKGMVCIRFYSYFGAFNPFDVTPTFCETLRAIGLPLPRMWGTLLESCGKLVLVGFCLRLRFHSNENHKALNFSRRWPVMKLDLKFEDDEQHHKWETVSTLHKSVQVTGSIVAQCGIGDRFYTPLNVHPNKEHLVYLTRLTSSGNQLVLCNTKSQTLTLLTPNNFFDFKKLDFPCWPTPIPRVLPY